VSALFSKDRMPSMYRVSDSINPKLSKTESKFHFQLQSGDPEESKLKISVNGVWRTISLDENRSFELKVQPGMYNFELLLNSEYSEITYNQAKIEGQHEQLFYLYFYPVPKDTEIRLKKPVVYFHSEIEREIELAVVPSDRFIFTYPESDGKWNGTIKPNKGIEIDGIAYPYLFWESEQRYTFKPEGNGYKVEKADAISFLTKKLDELGFNQQEKTDFITYWGPQLAENETSFVQFTVDDNCDKFATMACSPAPDFTRRVYIQISKWDSQFENYLEDVSFSPIPKSEWYILEWGGFSFQLQNIGSIK
jgi:hypothetical protein